MAKLAQFPGLQQRFEDALRRALEPEQLYAGADILRLVEACTSRFGTEGASSWWSRRVG